MINPTSFNPTLLAGQATSTLMNAAGTVQGQLQKALPSLQGAAGQLASQVTASAQAMLASKLGPAQAQLSSLLGQAKGLEGKLGSLLSNKSFDVNNLKGLATVQGVVATNMMKNLVGTPGEKIQQFQKLTATGGVPGLKVMISNNPLNLVSGQLKSLTGPLSQVAGQLQSAGAGLAGQLQSTGAGLVSQAKTLISSKLPLKVL